MQAVLGGIGSTLVLGAAVLALLLIATSAMFGTKRKNAFDPRDKHVYITGGSQGTGLALAKLLAGQGAHITIVARTRSKLESAVEQIKQSTVGGDKEQVVQYQSADLGVAAEAQRALQEAEKSMGKKVDYVFLCAGASHPGLFANITTDTIAGEMHTDYFSAAYTAHAAVKSFLTHPTPATCRLVFVSSMAGLLGLPGYSAYTAAKYAVRGLAESLRMELLAYGIKVHIFFPGTIFSPGYEEENKTKPAITKKLEESDEGVTCEKAAELLVRGVKKEYYSFGCDFTSDLVRSLTKGATPANNILDPLYAFIAWIAMVFWRKDAEGKVKKAGMSLS